MSSHHFVREEQEPALFVYKLYGNLRELMGQLLEWSPYVVVAEDEVSFFHTMGYKFDVVVSAENGCGAVFQDSVGVLRSHGDDAFSLVLDHLVSRGQRDINVLTSSDRLMIQAHVASRSKAGVVFFTAESKYLLFKGKTFSKWLPAGSSLTLATLNPGTTLQTLGFTKNILCEKLNDPQTLSVKQEGLIQIETDGPLLISEALTL